MALPIGGTFQRTTQPQAGAQVWGTGINAVHSFYGSPPLRTTYYPLRQGEHPQAPHAAVPEALLPERIWGYEPPPTGAGMETDNRPPWNVPPEDSPSRYSTQGHPPYTAPGPVNQAFREALTGAHRWFRGKWPRANFPVPSETVSEGWVNKANFGPVAEAKPSDPSQYEMQTSMAQRFQTRVNDHAVMRGTDGSRAPITSRVVPQRSPIYSGGERHYDMFPRQQEPWRIRPFFYRTAGTDDADKMAPNETYDIVPIQRVVPADPSLGPDETGVSSYGYTPEDRFYA